MSIAAANWPQGEAQDLARNFTAIAGETPFAERDTADYQRLIELGTRLAGTLPDAEAQQLRAALQELDLQVVRIGTVAAAMRFDRTSFSVVAGKPVKVIFENSDQMPHNLLVATPGSLEEVGTAADKMAGDPQGFAKSFVPDSDKVLVAGSLLQAGETGEIDFIAPRTPGDYPYICTFPGHWRTMNGVMVVLPDATK